MKKLLLGIFLILVLTACAQNRYTYRDQCDRQACYSKLAASQYTVRKPVEIIYEDTTYTTVYEPKTYVETRKVKKPYTNCRINGNDAYCN